MSRISYNGEYTYSFFSINRENIVGVINQWQTNYPDLREELELWKLGNEGHKITHKQTVFPIHRGKKIQCGFLKIYESGENDLLHCISIIGTFLFKVKFISRAFELIQKRVILMIKAYPIIMVALIMSESNELKIKWETKD